MRSETMDSSTLAQMLNCSRSLNTININWLAMSCTDFQGGYQSALMFTYRRFCFAVNC